VLFAVSLLGDWLTQMAHISNAFNNLFSLTFDFGARTVPFEDTMNKSSFLLTGSALFLLVALPLHAQTGCVTSPENPTALLAVVGSAGAFFVSARARIKARRSSSK
jgi:XrtJ-associated TM-motif-TM protein